MSTKSLYFSLFFTFGILFSVSTFANVSLPGSNCSGAIFRMPKMDNNQKALVLTSGHCVRQGTYLNGYLSEGEIIVNYSLKGVASVKEKKNSLGRTYFYSKILVATTTGTDLAVLEMEKTYDDIIKAGHRVYELSSSLPPQNMELNFNSVNTGEFQTCRSDKKVNLLKEGPWLWYHSVRSELSSQCILEPGQSGTAGVNSKDGLIYGVAQTVNEGGEPCSLGNPCEVTTNGAVLPSEINQFYFASVDVLFQCYNEDQQAFDFVNCPLGSGVR